MPGGLCRGPPELSVCLDGRVEPGGGGGGETAMRGCPPRVGVGGISGDDDLLAFPLL